MGYNIAGKYVTCWSCGYHPLLQSLVAASSSPAKEIRALLGDLTKEKPGDERLRRGKLVLPVGLGLLLPAHVKYLRGRGFDPEYLTKLWGIKGIGIAPRHQWTVWIPIHRHGEVVSWTTRRLVDKDPRYVNARPEEEILSPKSLLYGEDYCGLSIVVHEGSTDVWKTGPGATCTGGTGYSQAQVLRISKYPRRGICFDNLPEAQKVAEKLCSELECFSGETFNIVLDSKDSGVASEYELDILRRFING